MFVPFISKASTTRVRYRRKGGGGGGRGGGGGSRGGGSRGSSSGGRGNSGGTRGGTTGNTRPSFSIGSGANTGGVTSARPYGNGGGSVKTIPSGQMFAGRTQGGATRNDIYGSRTYGSGYPGITSRGVSGLGFPFYFWPVVWGGAAVGGGATYLHASEYGEPNNSSRPGGLLTTVPFSSSSGNTTLHIIADNTTTTSLLSSISSNCSSLLASNSTGGQLIVAFDPTNNSIPKPEQAVQYYRASSIVLTLDGYNNTVALNGFASLNDTNVPLPGWVNTGMLNCVNQTIGAAAPLLEEETTNAAHVQARGFGMMGILWVMIFLLKALL